MRQRQTRLRACGATADGRLRMERRYVWLQLCSLDGDLRRRCAGRSSADRHSGPSTAINPPVTITTDPAILFPAHRDVYLGTEDLLTVHIYGSTEYNPTVRVGLDGTLQLPLIGSVQVEGLTVHQAQDLIAQKLVSAGMYRDPQVSIQITDSPNQIATVVGEVHGIVPITGERRLYDVLAAAGKRGGIFVHGYDCGGRDRRTSSHRKSYRHDQPSWSGGADHGRSRNRSCKELRLADIPIFPRDTIIVPRVGVVYLLGAFKIQGAIPLSAKLADDVDEDGRACRRPGLRGQDQRSPDHSVGGTDSPGRSCRYQESDRR